MAKEIIHKLMGKKRKKEIVQLKKSEYFISMTGIPTVSPASKFFTNMSFHSLLLINTLFLSCSNSHSSIGFWAVTQVSCERGIAGI